MIVNVKIIERGVFIVEKDADALIYDPYKRKWIPFSELKDAWNGKHLAITMADDQKYMKALFLEMPGMQYTFIGYDRTIGALIVSKELFFDTVAEEW